MKPLRRNARKLTHSIALGGLVAGVLTAGGLPVPEAQAKIRCNGPYQIVKGHGEISTPYCGDNYLAKVARDFGVRVAARTIRNNPNKKEEVCRLVGFDIRVQDVCAGFRNDDGGRGGHF
ncbi:MAG: hypothetical protein AAFR75_01575 [Pseudomonadota bacterium]